MSDTQGWMLLSSPLRRIDSFLMGYELTYSAFNLVHLTAYHILFCDNDVTVDDGKKTMVSYLNKNFNTFGFSLKYKASEFSKTIIKHGSLRVTPAYKD